MKESEKMALIDQERITRAAALVSSFTIDNDDTKQVKLLLNKIWREEIKPNLPVINN